MKKPLALLIAATAWFAIVAQYELMIDNRVTPVVEATIRFFSFFTILTNALVALHFTRLVCKREQQSRTLAAHAGTTTAITVYITVVGLVYQLVLRHTWQPHGLQKLVDELLHSVVPVLVMLYWYLYEVKTQLTYRQIPTWVLYPLGYLVFILLRGQASGFYPYPFINVATLGLATTLLNSVGLLALFIGLSALSIKIGKARQPSGS